MWMSRHTAVKLTTGFFRGVILAILVVATCRAFWYAARDFNLILGFDFALIFHFSFKFGLVGWASFLRFFLAWLTFLEAPLAIGVEVADALGYFGHEEEVLGVETP